jgi:hypothetical protein
MRDPQRVPRPPRRARASKARPRSRDLVICPRASAATGQVFLRPESFHHFCHRARA